jgi:hypothetical protein
MVVTFDSDGDQLTSGAGPVNGFMVAGQDGIYYAAEASIDGDSVVVTSNDVPSPVTVRYAWAGVPHSTLTNSSQIPAAPFRTDQQPLSRGRGEVQRQAVGYIFKGKDYQATLSADGSISSLIVRNQQLLSNASGDWGGARVNKRELSKVIPVNSRRVIASNNVTSLTLDFDDDAIKFTISNKHPKEAALFDVALGSNVTVSGGETGKQTVQVKGATARFTGVDRVTKYKDIAAADGQVLETTVSPGQTETMEMQIISH